MEKTFFILHDLFNLFLDYWYVFSRNTMPHLGLFLLTLLLFFFLRHRKDFNRIRSSVNNIPLIVGGWGTRGKSGTERKKTAFFEALGLDVYSKTTGCEAMFLHSMPNAKAQELYLFRPYDKATIWEQGKSVQMASRLKDQVMCWECMALNPEYVRILQQEWMQDSIATLTNTYPDHEDIQGPAGRDIPYVMNFFIPKKGVVFTAEEQMFPILREEAEKKKSDIFQISWRDTFYLTPDVLDRYPYKVHPENMALVMQMGHYLGVENDFTLKEIADHIIPDIGVLKIYPEGRFLGRRLYFINGCSANERRGFLSNWVRMGLDRHRQDQTPDQWIVTVVNNRADRIPRSKVFADILVMDIAVHRHVLIGTNLTGLLGYIRETLDRRVASLDPASEISKGEPQDSTATYLKKLLDDLKWEAYSLIDVQKNISKMLTGLGLDSVKAKQAVADYQGEPVTNQFDPLLKSMDLEMSVKEDFVTFANHFLSCFVDFENLLDQVYSQIESGQAEAAAKTVKNAFLKGFNDRLLVIEDPMVNGDQIVYYLARHVPPGFEIQLMGSQNIKGTGLDFVYRWLALETTVEAAKDMFDPIEKKRHEALEFFAANKEYGLLNSDFAFDALNRALTHDFYQRIEDQKRIRKIMDSINNTRIKIDDVSSTQGGSVSQGFVLKAIEAVFESSESKRRVKLSEETYDLLCEGLISHDRAGQVLRSITKQQKGDWIADKYKQWKKSRAAKG